MKFAKSSQSLSCIFKTVFEILFGGYATPTKCEAFWRLALNSYIYFKCQISLLYSAIVLSDEKNPALLMLISAFFVHSDGFDA